MERFEGRVAVVTGGGTGMGRELARQLSGEGCHVAICDVSAEHMSETAARCEQGAPDGTLVSTFVADVSDRDQMDAFAAHVAATHATDHINLLFNNAGIGGGGSIVADPPDEWDKVFGVCWGGVYNGTRAFLPMLLAADEGHVVNTSSVNGFWACLGPNAHTAYSAAKFAVKGFTEALIVDFRQHAPHLRASVVMPGHIGTSIVFNSGAYFGRDPKELRDEHVAEIRVRLLAQGLDVSAASDEDVRQALLQRAEGFRDNAPTTAADAATVILDGVRAGAWRILVGDDAVTLDEMVRAEPESAYEPEFMERLRSASVFEFIPDGSDPAATAG
jgi:NAD(P)-dependent dehydrogenase (short-subunit alcohol dehydrogenase family)